MTSKERTEHRKYLRELKEKLYRKYCKQDNEFREQNHDRIDYVIDEVLSKQMLQENPAEQKQFKFYLTMEYLQNIRN